MTLRSIGLVCRLPDRNTIIFDAQLASGCSVDGSVAGSGPAAPVGKKLGGQTPAVSVMPRNRIGDPVVCATALDRSVEMRGRNPAPTPNRFRSARREYFGFS